nr:Thymidylate synthase complementing protein [uncultured bacterium]
MNTAKIVAITEPTSMKIAGAGDFVAYAARVSNPSNQLNTATSEKLLKYLARNKHWSPFEMVSVTMEIETTRDIARQILRHRSFAFQEFSQRYADPTKDLGFINNREARLQDTKNRQNSVEINDAALQREFEVLQKELNKKALAAYNWSIEKGIAKEQARCFLPEGLTVSRMYMAGTLRSWIHYCELRMGNGTQKEHKIVAEAAWNELLVYFQWLTEVVEVHDH